MPTASRHTPSALVLALLLTLALAGCRAPQQGGTTTGDVQGGVAVSVSVDGLRVGQGSVTVTVGRDAGPVSGATVTVQGDMTHAGMVPVIAAAEETEPGTYVTRDFAFSMAGDWIVTAEVELAGEVHEAESFVNVAR